MPEYLYFDHAAATALRPEAKSVLEQTLNIFHTNPSSVHKMGQKARGLMDEARIDLAEIFMVKPAEVIFTSGATEAIHTAIIGAYLAKTENLKKGVVYTSPLTHSCVWRALDFLHQQHNVTVKFLPLTAAGHLDLEKINETIIEESDLIITEHLNSEVGILQPAAKLGKKLIRWAEETELQKPIFIVDAAASAVSERVGLDFQKCDLLALSAEKIGGLGGCGVLLKKEGLALVPLQGGTQEWGWRGGTENVLGILALKEAYKALFQNQTETNKNLEAIKKVLLDFLKTNFPELKITTPDEGSGSHILHFLLTHDTASLKVVQADLAGVAISAGSACSSGSIEASKVLTGLGYDDNTARMGLRISWGWNTDLEEAKDLCERLKAILA